MVCMGLRAIVRHGVSEEIGPRQNKQTLKYSVDIDLAVYPMPTTVTNYSRNNELRMHPCSAVIMRDCKLQCRHIGIQHALMRVSRVVINDINSLTA